MGLPLALALLLLPVSIMVADLMHLFSLKYTMLKMQPAPPGAGQRHIRIMHDGQEAPILDELRARWRARMRKLYAGINFANDVEKEVAKFSFLKEHAIISDEEYREAVDRLRVGTAHNSIETERGSIN